MVPRHQRIVTGVEVEAYTILLPEYAVSRRLAFPRKGLGEHGERFVRDWSIGTEYNSRPFNTVREGLFLLKAGLRKYNTRLYRRRSMSRKGIKLLLVGGWRDRFAGAHIHMSVAERKLDLPLAKRLAYHIHDHIPLLVALGANSPVWADEITGAASNRILRASKLYFTPLKRGELGTGPYEEILYSKGRVTKPPTLEVRVLDSNLPEYVLAAVTIVKAAALACLSRKPASNKISHLAYMQARAHAARWGMDAELCWNGRWIKATEYLDRFVWTHREEFGDMDLPQEMWTTLRLLKKGVSGASLIGAAARASHEHHPQTWQRRFAKRYCGALDRLLSGETVTEFADRLGVEVPGTRDVWLGRRRLRLS